MLENGLAANMLSGFHGLPVHSTPALGAELYSRDRRATNSAKRFTQAGFLKLFAAWAGPRTALLRQHESVCEVERRGPCVVKSP